MPIHDSHPRGPADDRAVIAHLSDCHLPPLPPLEPRHLNAKRTLGWLNWQRKRRFLYERAAVDALVADIGASAVDHVAVTGDLVNLGLPAEYAAARDWLTGVGPPERVSVVPGNHDIYVEPEASAGVALWAAHMADDRYGESLPRDASRPGAGPGSASAVTAAFPYVRRVGPVALIGVNSSCPTAIGYAGGTVGPMQRRRLAGLLERLGADGLVRVVLIHHPPKVGVCPPGRALGDAADVEAVIARHGAELVLHGHNHVVEATRIGATRLHGIASAGMARAYRHEPPARYSLITVTRTGGTASIRIETRGIDGAAMHSPPYPVRSFGIIEFECGLLPAAGDPVR